MAGITADVRAQTAIGAHTACVITGTTAQSSKAVFAANVSRVDAFESQLSAAASQPFSAIKLGVLLSGEQADSVARFAKAKAQPLVWDPVLAPSSGGRFVSPELSQHFRNTLLPVTSLLTANLHEAAELSGLSVSTPDEIELAAAELIRLGAKAVLIKGGHSEDYLASSSDLNAALHSPPKFACDYFFDGETGFWLRSRRLTTDNSRATGCTLASAIAAALARDYPLFDAIVIGKMLVQQALSHSYSISDDISGPVFPQNFPATLSELPELSYRYPGDKESPAFPRVGDEPLGLYPIVDTANWLARLLPLGVRTAQLRNKNLSGAALEKEIARAITIGRQHQCRVFINDYWELAIKHGAYGVHLGQEDLATADLKAIRNAGLRLGLSSHCHYEVARAHTYRPSYIACGPVYDTTTKIMPWLTHGPEGLQYWVNCLQPDYPLVAIGGINTERFDAINDTGVDSIAMITAITEAQDPEAVTQNLLAAISLR